MKDVCHAIIPPWKKNHHHDIHTHDEHMQTSDHNCVYILAMCINPPFASPLRPFVFVKEYVNATETSLQNPRDTLDRWGQ